MTKDELQVKSENYALLQVMKLNKINFAPAEIAVAYEAGANETLSDNEILREILVNKEIEIADLKAKIKEELQNEI